jgi:hypothetical protein
MSGKIALLLFCVVVNTECQTWFPVQFPGSFSNGYSGLESRYGNREPPVSKPGTLYVGSGGIFHSQRPTENPYGNNHGLHQVSQKSPEEESYLNNQDEQNYNKNKPQTIVRPPPSKNSQKPSLVPIDFEDGQNNDQKQQSANKGQNPEYTSINPRPNYSSQVQPNRYNQKVPSIPSHSNKYQHDSTSSFQPGQTPHESNVFNRQPTIQKNPNSYVQGEKEI